jgi:hypothetical protein
MIRHASVATLDNAASKRILWITRPHQTQAQLPSESGGALGPVLSTSCCCGHTRLQTCQATSRRTSLVSSWSPRALARSAATDCAAGATISSSRSRCGNCGTCSTQLYVCKTLPNDNATHRTCSYFPGSTVKRAALLINVFLGHLRQVLTSRLVV